MDIILQLALDFVDLPRALKVAEEAVLGGVDWLEAGTPLIKSEGLECVRQLKKKFPHKTIVADMKTIDAGRTEVECALKAGARVVHVLAGASNSTIKECLEAAENYGGEIIVDLIEVLDEIKRAKQLEELGVQYLCVHTAIDEQMQGKYPFEKLKKVVQAVTIPVAVAGGINSETASLAVESGAKIIIVGGAITKSTDAKEATRQIKKALEERIKIQTTLFKRVTSKNIREVLEKVSTPNISDAMHRQGDLQGIICRTPNVKMVGEAYTVRTYPGDVEAIDFAKPAEVIVIDAGGAPPAVWGELATNSCLQKGIKGVVIDGALRDTPEIKALNFPAFSKIVTPTAGEPKGLGELNVPVTIGGIKIHPGDWIVGDEDGVMVIPKEKSVEIANRAMDILEKENRLRKEIQQGNTLSQVAYLEKWEKKI